MTPVLRMSRSRYVLLEPSYDELFGIIVDRGPTTDLATVDGTGSIRLAYGVPPGTWEWAVTDALGRVSTPRRFTVEPQPFDRLVVRRIFDPRSTDADAGLLYLEIHGAPYAAYEFTVRHGPAVRTQLERTTRDGRLLQLVYPTCDRPGGTLRRRLVGRDALGNQRTATGSLRNVARAECERVRRLDVERARAEARRKAERERRRREEDRRRREESRRLEREHVERFKRQCDALTGRLVTYYHSNRNEYRCYLPSGGYLVI